MRKRRAGSEENLVENCRDRVLARVLAEDLRAVRGAEDELSGLTVTDPPPGRDVTFHGSDGGEMF
jgi:hypothetical protein